MPLPRLHPKTLRALQRAHAAHAAGDVLGALARYQRILRREPSNPLALHYGALACHQLGRNDTAVAMMLACLREVPDHADSWFNLGKFYRETGDEERAGMAYLAALEHDQQHIEALVSAGDHYWQRGDAEGASRLWDFALSIVPRGPEARHYQSFVRLRRGDTARGWADYEARWQCKAFASRYARAEYDALPQWRQGDDPETALAGKRLLVHGEQGLGDQIQMVRYLRWLRLLAAEVTVEVLPPLVRLVQASFPWARVFARGEPLPGPVDLAVPSMSLPARFGGRFPAEVPYLMAPPFVVPPPPATARRIGVVWAGSKGHANDRNRSMDVAALAPLWDVPGVTWVSLQVGERADEAPAHLRRYALGDFADTAAIVRELDLVIAVDTSTAHLAGALGVPVWMMVPRLVDHRWGLTEETTPYYPSMRIFRQPVAGDWTSVVARVADDLRALTREQAA